MSVIVRISSSESSSPSGVVVLSEVKDKRRTLLVSVLEPALATLMKIQLHYEVSYTD